MEKEKMQIECIKGLTNMMLDNIYYLDLKHITKEEAIKQITSGIDLLKIYTDELEVMLKEGEK